MKKSFKIFVAVLLLNCISTHAQDAKLKMTFAEKDSVKTVKLFLTKAGADGVQAPIKGVDIKVGVQRAFSLLPVEGDHLTTDENGEASVVFPKDIPGDSEGKVTVVAKIEDNDDVGDVQVKQDVKWGTLLQPDLSFTKRALWQTATNAPLPLVIFVTSMIALVWGIIFYIIYLMFLIKKLGKQVST
jgi:hypothetical protein